MSPADPIEPADQASLRRFRGEQAAHSHDHAQVLFGLHGALELQAGHRSWRVDATCGLVIPPDMAHGLAATGRGDAGAQVLVVDTRAAHPKLDRLRAFALPAGWAAHQLQQWGAGSKTPGAFGAPLQPSVQPLAAQADAWLQAAGAAPRALPRRRLDAERMHAAVQGRWHEDWPSTRLAALAALSVPQFNTRWRALTGLSPQAWLRQQRLDEAERRLSHGQWLDTVAAAVGYASGSALATALRRDRGLRVRALR